MPSCILGTANFGQAYGINSRENLSLDSAAELLALAQSAGITTFDTAFGYGNSHQILGNAVSLGILTSPNFITKIKIPHSRSSLMELEQYITQGVTELHVERIYGLLLHNPADFNRPEGWEVLRSLKAKQLVEKVGISVYAPDEILGCQFRNEVDLIQLPYNLFDHRWDSFDWNNAFNSGKVPEIHARSIFLQGLLLANSTTSLRYPSSIAEPAKQAADYTTRLARELNAPSAELCIRYARAMNWIDALVIGNDTVHQLRETLEAFAKPTLSLNEISKIRLERPKAPTALLDPRQW